METITLWLLSLTKEKYMLHLNNRTKKYPDFGKICPDCVHLSVKFPIENAVLRVSG